MAKPTLLKSVNLTNKDNNFEFFFEESITGKLILESEIYQDNQLPLTIKILLNKEKEKNGGFIVLPKQKTIDNNNLSFFKQRITANQLSFFKLKVEEQKTNYNFKINIYKESN